MKYFRNTDPRDSSNSRGSREFRHSRKLYNFLSIVIPGILVIRNIVETLKKDPKGTRDPGDSRYFKDSERIPDIPIQGILVIREILENLEILEITQVF